ncbi:MAG: alanine racemase, partial [Woeseiaceae bacterium]
MSSAARVRIRLGAIRQNFEFLKKVSRGSHLMAVIKANAYGHGLVSVAMALGDADCLAVARLSEAKTLRASGVDSPIVVLGGLLAEDEVAEALALRLQFCVHCEEQISWLQNSATGNAIVWLKIDTGMNRLGFRVEEVESVLEKLQHCSAIGELRIMTHLANADNRNDAMTGEQIRRFASSIEGFQGDISISNSAGMLGWPAIDELFNDALEQGRLWNRPGLSLYGLSPFPDSCGADLGLTAAMQLETQIMAVKNLRAGDRV